MFVESIVASGASVCSAVSCQWTAVMARSVAPHPLGRSDAAIALPAGDVAHVQGREAAVTAALSAEVEKQLGVASHRFFVQVLSSCPRVGVNARRFVVPQMQRRMYGSAAILLYANFAGLLFRRLLRCRNQKRCTSNCSTADRSSRRSRRLNGAGRGPPSTS